MVNLYLSKEFPLEKSIQKPRPGLWQVFTTWLVIGAQSFGGGTSTLILIHQACMKHGWVAEDEFVRLWALVQIAPGINLVKFTILLGHRLRGWPGLLAACSGLLLPSAGVTVLMTAGFTAIQGQPLVKAAMRGVMPATVGLSLAMGAQMAQPLFGQAIKEGRPRLAAHLLISVCAALLLGLYNASPVLVLLAAGTAAVLLLPRLPLKPARSVPGASQ